MTDKVVVFSTCSTMEEAERLARKLIDARLAACVTVVPGVRSFYRWKGAVEDSSELLLVIKTTRARFESLRTALESAHSYEVPEVVAVPVIAGAANYLAWLEDQLK